MSVYNDCPGCGRKKTRYKALCWDCWSKKRLQIKQEKLNGSLSVCRKCGIGLNNDNWSPYNKKKVNLICKKCYSTRMKEYNKKKLVNNPFRRLRLKYEVISHYGGKCACCGEQEIDFLNLDHIFNDGADHRRKVGSDMYLWAKRNKYPDIFQVLCMNCNFAKGKTGVCPHEIERQRLIQAESVV